MIKIEELLKIKDIELNISYLFGIHKNNVKELLDLGFEYCFITNKFKSVITINNFEYPITISRNINEKVKCFELYIPYSSTVKQELKCNFSAVIYVESTENIPNISTNIFKHWLYNLYTQNQKAEEGV